MYHRIDFPVIGLNLNFGELASPFRVTNDDQRNADQGIQMLFELRDPPIQNLR